ncbi:MAG: hypothetical protein IJC28_00095, partial [Mailhella sp.]|nr:hypothetical protein [Mailhella sp.]
MIDLRACGRYRSSFSLSGPAGTFLQRRAVRPERTAANPHEAPMSQLNTSAPEAERTQGVDFLRARINQDNA